MASPDLHQPLIISLFGGGLLAAFLHAALPTHWLPFVLVARAQSWRLGRLLSVTALAATAHIASTAVVGGAIALAGVAVDHLIDGLLPLISGCLLIVLGAFYMARATLRQPAVASGPSLEPEGSGVSNSAAVLGLIGMMAISPGEVLLPVYLTWSGEGMGVYLMLTLAFLIGTLGGMLLLTALAYAGWSILRLERWARYEGAVLGLALIGLGLLVLVHHH